MTQSGSCQPFWSQSKQPWTAQERIAGWTELSFSASSLSSRPTKEVIKGISLMRCQMAMLCSGMVGRLLVTSQSLNWGWRERVSREVEIVSGSPLVMRLMMLRSSAWPGAVSVIVMKRVAASAGRLESDEEVRVKVKEGTCCM